MCRALRAQYLATSHPLDPQVCLIGASRVRPCRATFDQRLPRHPRSSYIKHLTNSAHRVFEVVAHNQRPSISAPARVSDRPSQDLPALACASRSSIDYKHGIAQLATSNLDQRRYACASQDDSHSNIPSYYKRQICRRQPECRALEMTPSRRRSGP